jgi:hypothetical protein
LAFGEPKTEKALECSAPFTGVKIKD